MNTDVRRKARSSLLVGCLTSPRSLGSRCRASHRPSKQGRLSVGRAGLSGTSASSRMKVPFAWVRRCRIPLNRALPARASIANGGLVRPPCRVGRNLLAVSLLLLALMGSRVGDAAEIKLFHPAPFKAVVDALAPQ